MENNNTIESVNTFSKSKCFFSVPKRSTPKESLELYIKSRVLMGDICVASTKKVKFFSSFGHIFSNKKC